jgi:dTDP-4-dehydrorhamnose 3,5-epimerase
VSMEVVELPLAGLRLVRPRVFRDPRGFFFESHHAPRFAEHGIDLTFVQDNHSRSMKDVVRGLHYQASPGQAKLVRVARGRIFDVAVDLRPESPTFGRWYGAELDDERCELLLIPVGFAHGFCVLSDVADVIYKVSAPYDAAEERTLAYDDPDVGVSWPTTQPLVSERDRAGESFAEYRRRRERP